MNKIRTQRRGTTDTLRDLLLSIAKGAAQIDTAHLALENAISDYKSNAQSLRGLNQSPGRMQSAQTRATLDTLRSNLAAALAAVEQLDGESQTLLTEQYSRSGSQLVNLTANLKLACKATQDAARQAARHQNTEPDYYQEMLALDVAMVMRYVLNIDPAAAQRAHSAAKYARLLEKVVQLADTEEIDLEKLTAAGLRRMHESGHEQSLKR